MICLSKHIKCVKLNKILQFFIKWRWETVEIFHFCGKVDDIFETVTGKYSDF